MIMEKIKIYTEFIKLYEFLKFSGLTVTGGQAKAVISEGLVKVNGEVCTLRGKKLFGGETVEFSGKEIKVIH